MSTAVMDGPRATFLPESPPLPPVDARNRFFAWEANEVVHVGATVIGSVNLLPGEDEILAGLRLPYTVMPELSHDQHWREGITSEQRFLLWVLRNAFRIIVHQDRERSGLGHGHSELFAGQYSSRKDLGGVWHPDYGYRPIVRYVASLGAGATDFAEGELRKDQPVIARKRLRRDAIAPKGPLSVVNYGAGAVCRFMAAIDPHAGPKVNGPRAFMVSTVGMPE